MIKIIILIFLLLASLSVGVKLPTNFKKCNRNQSDFSDCLTKAVEDALRQLKKPIRKLGLQLDPVEIKSLSVNAGNTAIHFQQNYENYKILGFSNATCSKVDMNFERKNLTMQCNFPKIKVTFMYKFEGSLLIIPIRGAGPGGYTLENLNVHQSFKLEEYENKGEKYFKVIESKFVMNTELLHEIQLENLFDGDEVLTKQINKAFNENWELVFYDVKTNYEDVLAQVFSAIFNNLLIKVPVSELFGN